MSGTLFRSICRQYLVTFLGVYPAVILVFLVADFAQSTKLFRGRDWIDIVPVFYWNKGLVTAHLIAPAAVLLSAGFMISALRKRGELSALRALGFSPAAILYPVALCAFFLSLGVVALDENVVTKASRRVDDISILKLHRHGDWRSWFAPKQWFRRGRNVFHLGQGDTTAGFTNVMVLTLNDDFTLERRLDAERLLPEGGTRWRLEDVVERHLDPVKGQVSYERKAVAHYDFGVDPSAFRIKLGRPEQMRIHDLSEQIGVRAEVGLESRSFVLALHNRFSYPLAGVPGALLAVMFALRFRRKGHLTTALVEGLCVIMSMWGLIVVCRTLVLSGRVSPQAAAWAPCALLGLATALLWLRYEGYLGPQWLRVRRPEATT